MTTQIEWQVLNPTAEYETARYARAPRVANLDNKKIGLFWNGKPDGDTLLGAFGELLQKQFKDIELIKFDAGQAIGAENTKQIAEKSDAVIGAVGD